MMQDSKSRLWLGTLDDLICFDGVRYYSLRQYGYPKETANAFAEDDAGGIWVATQGTAANGGNSHGGLYRYQAGRVEKILPGDGLSVVSVAPGLLLASMGTEAQGKPAYGDLYRIARTGTGWKADLVKTKAVNHMTVDHHGAILFPCPGGWCELSRRQVETWNDTQTAPALEAHIGGTLVERVLRDRFGCVWFRAEGQANYQCPGMEHPANMPDTISMYDSSAHLEEASDGSILMLVSLALGRPGNFKVARKRNGLPTGMDTAMMARDGTIWIGAETGLYRFMYPFRLEYWKQANGFSAYSLLRVGSHMFAAGNSGLVSLSEDRASWRPLPGTDQLGSVGSLTPGPKGTLLATMPHGVVQLRRDGQILARSPVTGGPMRVGSRLAAAPDGRVWFGQEGIDRLTVQKGRLGLTPESVPANGIMNLRYDSGRETLWACDGHELLFRQNGAWHQITRENGLLNADCRYIALHPDGDIWLGYNLSAFSLIKNPTLDRMSITNYNTNGLGQFGGTGVVAFLGVDLRGRLWLGSDADYVATPKAAESGEWLRLDPQDGIPMVGSTNSDAFLADQDGSVWFGAQDTLVHFSPTQDFATEFPAPPVFVSGFSVGKAAPALVDAVSPIPYGHDVVAHIGSLQFERRNALRFRHRVLPDQPSWVYGREPDVRLGKPGWGEHRLEVQAQLGTGPWSPIDGRSFSVLRPIWLSLPSLLGFGAIVSAGAASVARWRKKRHKRATMVLPKIDEWRLSALSPELHGLDGPPLDARFATTGKILARGGFATVVEGRDLQQDGGPCAVKIFRRECVDEDWLAKRFRQEVLALQRIQHPNIVRICGHGKTPNGAPYLVMELIEGETLAERLQREQLTPRQIARYLRQTGSALAEIHARGICHRDVKPENLMIRNGGSAEEEVVLIDFSIAIVKDPDEKIHGVSRAAGTLQYMAPEQAIGYADPSSDIYSLAKVVIEMLTGKRIFELLPDASIDLPDRIREMLQQLPVTLSPSSIELVSRAFEFHPFSRPQDANAFAAAIAHDLEAGMDRAQGTAP